MFTCWLFDKRTWFQSEQVMSNAIVSQVPKNLMFKYRVSCRRYDKNWSDQLQLPAEYKIPSFGNFEEQLDFADIRMAWNKAGLFVNVIVTGKQKALWCRSTQLLESDGLQLWIDARNTQNIHRASKFCHWFLLLPAGGGSRNDQPLATMLRINRAKEDPPMFNPKSISIAAAVEPAGYALTAFIPANSINGWNTEDQRNLGFSFAVIDRELGWQTLAVGPELPFNEDPSLWHTLQLVEE
jgi:hypothetical protein